MDYYSSIKKELLNNEIIKKVKNYSINRSDLNTYYNVGKLLNDAGKHYGKGIITEYSKKLTGELGKGYTFTSLTRMRKYYILVTKLATVSQQLTYGHYCELIPLNDLDKIKYYIKISEQNNLSVRQLREKIKSKEYERLSKTVISKIIDDKKTNIIERVPNPILIKNTGTKEIITERILQHIILEDIPSFLESLGKDFTFIKNEYRIKIGSNYNYIDLLLFNIKYNCYVVIELKVTELKKEHIGQIEVYMNYIDQNVKRSNHNKTIGIILVKKDNQFIMAYCSDRKIEARTYILV